MHGCSPLGHGWYGPGAWLDLDETEPGYDPSYIPTVSDMADARAAHEQRNGPALLIVNDVQWVRPLREDGLREMDSALTLSGSSVGSNFHRHAARARDLRELASRQPDAPTVAIWTGVDEYNHGLMALRYFAVVHITVARETEALHFTVETRASIDDQWSAPRHLQGGSGPDLSAFLGLGDLPVMPGEAGDDQSGG